MFPAVLQGTSSKGAGGTRWEAGKALGLVSLEVQAGH